VSSQQSTETAKPSVLKPDLTVIRAPGSPAAQAYRAVRESLRYAKTEQPVRSVLLADAGSRDQAGETAANLAASFALSGEMTVLVDADATNPVQHRLLNTPQNPGLFEWLTTERGCGRLTPRETAIDCLSVVPAGSPSGEQDRSMADLLTTAACTELIEQLSRTARYVLFHAPSLPASSEALAIAPQVDAVLLLVRSGTTKRTDAQRAKESLERVGANILGVVLTDTR
jgi:capsular exopolysaccharide synthesis family protein